MDDRAAYAATPRRRGLTGPLLALAIAFLLGIALTIAAVRHWDRLALLVHPAAAPPAAPVAPAIAPRVLVQPVAIPTSSATEEVLSGRITSIEGRIDAIDARAEAASGDADRAEALLVAFAARRALDRGQALGYLEGLLRERFGASDAPSVALVIAAAQRPVTLAMLQDGLAALGPTLATPANDGWWTGLRRELGSLFVVRRADSRSALPGDRIDRAARALDHGQVDAAAAEVARMPGRAGGAQWLASARRYLLARNALDKLETVALLKPANPAD